MKASVFPEAVPVVTMTLPPRARRRVRVGLVCVELVDPAPRERFPYARLEGVRKRRGSRLARGLGGEVGELVTDEELVPEAGGGHPTIEAG